MENNVYKNYSTRDKASEINHNSSIYGTFAEIGAGQEVAASFFKAGHASGTIAKTMSAYDMTFSDAIYGPATRYVSRKRLECMLAKEYHLLTRRLTTRRKRSTFFAFANTVKTGQGDKHGEGWVGVRFQLHANSEPNECIIHVVMKDKDIRGQQEVLATIGVNLLFACYFLSHHPDAMIRSLIDNVQRKQIEVDMFEIKGVDFSYVDNRLMSLKLVKHGLTQVAMFGPDGLMLQPSEALYQRDILVLRGRFRPVTYVNVDMMISSLRQFRKEEGVDRQKMLMISEITLRDLSPTGEEEIDEQDFLDRVDILCSLGQTVLISNYLKYYRLCKYISSFAYPKKIGIIIGYNNLLRIFDEKYYENLQGGALEALGQLFRNNSKIYVYPSLKENKKGLLTCQNANLGDKQLLFKYLYEAGYITDLAQANTSHLHIISDEVLHMLQNDEAGWEKYVPHKVSRAIKENALFNYPAPVEMEKED